MRGPAVALLLALAACTAGEGGGPAGGEPAGAAAPVAQLAPGAGAASALPLPPPQPGAGDAPSRAPLVVPDQIDAPDIYMALQPDSGGTVSVVFAIDAARDNTPRDDPAIRLTPENGLCNPQELRRYDFPDLYAARPVFSVLEARERVTSDKLPRFLALAVTSEMIRQGLAGTPEDTRPQHVCTLKLWQRLVSADAQAQLAGQ